MDDQTREKYEKKIAERHVIEEKVVAVFDVIEPGCKFPYPSVFERLISIAAEGEGEGVSGLRWTGLGWAVKISDKVSKTWDGMHDADKELMWRLFFSHYIAWFVEFHERTLSLQKVLISDQLVDNVKQISHLVDDAIERSRSRWP